MVHSIENGGMRQNMIDLKQVAPRSEVDRMECDHEAQGQRTCTAGGGSGAEKIIGRRKHSHKLAIVMRYYSLGHE